MRPNQNAVKKRTFSPTAEESFETFVGGSLSGDSGEEDDDGQYYFESLEER